MDNYELLALPFISFAAFFLKAMTGFGPAIIVISIGSVLFPPHAMIAASSILDFIAGAILFKSGGAKSNPQFLIGLVAAIAIGTALGAAALSLIPAEQFKPLLGIAIFLLAVWFIFFRMKKGAAERRSALADSCDTSDLSFSFASGVCGGLFGISGPPIIWHLGRRYKKEAFRALLITIFLVASLTRIISYTASGMMTETVFTYVLASLPGQLLGLYVGGKVFMEIDEKRFSQIVGCILLAISLKLVL